ncbi:MAG: Y-family DNA polymerase [Clostridium sp.]|nr:Y-family DNA polymerase [Clostridium sp.]
MVGLIDCDNFFCSCERVFRPDLARRPVVVLSNNDGCVVARSREVKDLGIPEGIPYYQLLQRYPDAGIVAFSSNYTLYGDMSARIMSILREEAPDVIQYSIDEAFLDLEGMDRIDLKLWGERLCRRVLRSTGMPVSLGIAPSRTLAKMASKYAKRYPAYNKCCLIGNDRQRETALRLFPVGDVWGIGHRSEKALAQFGVRSAWDFASMPRQFVRSRFHLPGERTWRELNGENVIDIEAMEGTARKTIVTSRSFPQMLTDIADLRSHVANYAARCAAKLRRQGSACSMVTVFVQSNHFREDLPQYDRSASATFATPTCGSGEIVRAALEVLDHIFLDGIHYKRGGVMVSDISEGDAVQPDLFTFDSAGRRRDNALSSSLDRINSRLGADTIVFGSQQYRDRGPDGRSVRFVNAIRRAMKSPDYTTCLGALTVG